MWSICYGLACCVLIGISAAVGTSTKICPLLGPAFPAPSSLGSNEQFKAATASFDTALTTTLETGISTNGPGQFNATTFSIGMFSTWENDLVYQRHYTDPSVRTSVSGTQNVDADSIYRVGSISKLLTVYLFLIREGDQRFNDPVTKYIPELAAAAASTSESPHGITPNWNEITIGQLASQMSGIAMDYGASDYSYPWLGLPGSPPIPENQVPTCNYPEANGSFKPCSPQEFLSGLTVEPAPFLSGYTPAYSNNAFILLGLALENITDSDLGQIFNESLVEALCLRHTSFTIPSSTQNGVIPGNATSSGWNSNLGVLSAAGGYFSSTNDLATLGRAILNATLLSKPQTRRWMKPVTFTSDVKMGIGAPWEIYRTQVSGRTVDLYIKNGGGGDYAANFVLVPDYDFGFSILSASALDYEVSNPLVYFTSDMIASTVLPVLEKVARDQANATFAGHYASSNLNSSLEISVDDQPGLRVTRWVSNGTQFLDDLGQNSAGQYVDFRLHPNQLYTGNKTGFTGTWQVLPSPIYTGPFDINCLAWAGIDSVTFGNVGIEEFVFEIDTTREKATSVQPMALRINLEKKS